MSTNAVTKQNLTLAERRADMIAKAQAVDEIALSAAGFMSGGGFAQEIMLAQAMNDLRASLTNDLMLPVMGLMNTDLGFKTDRDPNGPMKDGQRATPYPIEVVRECFIESKLRGFHAVGNEWNIIAGRFYACKNGLRRKVTSLPGITEFRDTYEVPRMAGDKGSIVKCKATWQLNGNSDSLDAEIPIRVNAFMGTDAILGKAERKLLKRVLDRVSGFNTPDGDAGDQEVVTQIVPPGAVGDAPKFGTPKTPPIDADEVPGAEVPANPIPTTQAAGSATASTPATKPAGAAGEPATAPGGGGTQAPAAGQGERVNQHNPAALTKQEAVMELLENAGITFDVFRGWLGTTGRVKDPDSIGSFDDIPDAVYYELTVGNYKSLAKCVTLYGQS